MKKTEITKDALQNLLNWLDPDSTAAALKYEVIYKRLVKIFYANHYSEAEDLADETINRVAKKVKLISETYKGDRSLYFYAVAKKLLLECSRLPKTVELPTKLAGQEPDDKDSDINYQCLTKCLNNLPSDQYQLIIGYYEGEKTAKIEQRKKMRQLLGISEQTLRVRALRIRQILEKCILKCVRNEFS